VEYRSLFSSFIKEYHIVTNYATQIGLELAFSHAKIEVPLYHTDMRLALFILQQREVFGG